MLVGSAGLSRGLTDRLDRVNIDCRLTGAAGLGGVVKPVSAAAVWE